MFFKKNKEKEHKFFERYLDNDLNILASELNNRYGMIERSEVSGVKPLGENEGFVDSGSISTIKWREYNVFQFHIEGIRNLYNAVRDMTKEACQYYNINFDEQKYMMQGWFNINYADNGKLNWHDHSDGDFAPFFHGYYCVKAEPSSTYYMLYNNPDLEVENINKNNRAILSEMGHPHAMGDWNWSGPRITVAYDVVPFERIKQLGVFDEQHWIPLS